MMIRPRTAAAVGFAGGFLAGMIVWTERTHNFRRDLFSESPWRRLFALGYLRGQRSTRSVLLLRDYVGWEQEPRLRRRGEKILRHMESSLD